MQKPQRRVMGSTGWAGLDDVNPSANTSRPSFRDATSPDLSDPTEDSSGCSKAEMMQLINMLPSSVRATLQEHPQMESLVEIVMDLGRVPFARFASEEAALSSQPVSEADIAEAVQRVCPPNIYLDHTACPNASPRSLCCNCCELGLGEKRHHL